MYNTCKIYIQINAGHYFYITVTVFVHMHLTND